MIKRLLGIVLGVVPFLFVWQTTLSIGLEMGDDLGLDVSVITIVISLSAVFSSMFIMVADGVGDRFACVKVAMLGNLLGIIGSLLIALAFGGAALLPRCCW